MTENRKLAANQLPSGVIGLAACVSLQRSDILARPRRRLVGGQGAPDVFERIHPYARECTIGDERRTLGDGTSILWAEVERLERSVTIRDNEITLKTGDASIVLKSDGSVVISGKEITVESSGRINVKASGDLVLKGARVLEN